MRLPVLSSLCLLALPLLVLAEGLATPTPPTPTQDAAAEAGESARRGRFFLPNLWPGGRRCGVCPAHVCNVDPAVIHGYCCGCARWLDRVPFSCPGSLTCPLDIRQLCQDYDFMMDCCC